MGVRIEGTVLQERIEKLHSELEHRGFRFRPHCWLSDEWFSPDGVPGIAIPFYLAHPRLARLEHRQLLEVEGGRREWCMRILRHEAGHAIDTAYRLHRRRRWRDVFGRSSQPYPEEYQPKPYSKSYVHHLGQWYAQSHPAEDFAETFAVWLKPRSRWRTEYQQWPAIKKLEYVDLQMREICEERPVVSSREHVEPVRLIRKTLREHYQSKRDRYGIGKETWFDRELYRLFAKNDNNRHLPLAATFLREHRREFRQHVAEWTGQYHYTIDQILQEMIDRCRELKLRVNKPAKDLTRDVQLMLTVQTMKLLRNSSHKVAL